MAFLNRETCNLLRQVSFLLYLLGFICHFRHSFYHHFTFQVWLIRSPVGSNVQASRIFVYCFAAYLVFQVYRSICYYTQSGGFNWAPSNQLERANVAAILVVSDGAPRMISEFREVSVHFRLEISYQITPY